MHPTTEVPVSKQRIGKHIPICGIVENGVFYCGRASQLTISSRELSCAKITEKRWQRDSWQLQQRMRLRVPELVHVVGSWQLAVGR
jgi:hypothetical protein